MAATVVLASLAASSSALGASITSSGPLTQIGVTEDLNCSLNHVDDSEGEFYADTACGTFLATGGTLYGPLSTPSGVSVTTPVTPVSQSAVTGSGTESDPYMIVTSVDLPGSGLSIEQTDSYVVGRDSYTTDVKVTNATASVVNATLYRAGDCYLQSDDQGFGEVDSSTGAVACRTAVFDGVDLVPGGRFLEWSPLTGGSSYTENYYETVWNQIGAQAPFPNMCICTTATDNGSGLSWDIAVPPSGSVTISHTTRVTRLAPYQMPLSASGSDLSLVPAFERCGTGSNPTNSTHGGASPLDVASCDPPVPSAAVARVGPEAVASVKTTAVPGNGSTVADEADLAIEVNATDVRTGSPTGADYDPNPAGDDLTLVTLLRITDSYNGPGQTAPGTVTDLDFSVPVNCAATSGAIGAACTVTTTADTLIPDAIPEKRNSVIQSFRARLNDSGMNGTRGDGDDTLFEQQGVFVGENPASPPSYQAPASASPLATSLTPSFTQCGTAANLANSAHAAPLSVESCSPPKSTAYEARVGSQAVGSAKVSATPGSPAGGDQAGISFEASATDVRLGSVDGADYNPNLTGPDLSLTARWRVTDTNNGTSQTAPATTTDLDFRVPIECVGTPDATIGASCAVLTDADTLYPGSVPEGKNMIVQIFRLGLLDSGPDVGTSDDTLFEQQGLFVP